VSLVLAGAKIIFVYLIVVILAGNIKGLSREPPFSSSSPLRGKPNGSSL
jgi:hypothetical protein